MTPQFQMSQLVATVSNTICDKKSQVVKLIIANAKDPIKSDHWLKVLLQIISYEQQLFQKIQRFDFDQPLVDHEYLDLEQALDYIINA